MEQDIESDVSQEGAPSEAPEQASSEPAPESDAQASAPEQEVKKELSFDQHPRFKELIEQKNQYAEQMKAYEARMTQLESRLQQQTQREQPKPQEDPLIARLKGIDPEFGKSFEELMQVKQTIAEFQQYKQQQELQSMYADAENRINKLYTEHKVDDQLKPLYMQGIKALAYENPGATPKDVERFFKAVHDQVSKPFEEFRRKDRESYVATKKADATPTSQTGGAPAGSGSKPKGPMSKSELVSEIAKQIRAGKENI